MKYVATWIGSSHVIRWFLVWSLMWRKIRFTVFLFDNLNHSFDNSRRLYHLCKQPSLTDIGIHVNEAHLLWEKWMVKLGSSISYVKLDQPSFYWYSVNLILCMNNKCIKTYKMNGSNCLIIEALLPMKNPHE